MPQFGASLTDDSRAKIYDSRLIIYDRNMFMIEATAYMSVYNSPT